MAIKFICPECQCNQLECCMNGAHACAITEIDKDGDFEYGEYESSAGVDRYQCLHCGYVLMENEDTLTDNIEVVEWCEKHCSQE